MSTDIYLLHKRLDTTKNKTIRKIYQEVGETFCQGVITEAEWFIHFTIDFAGCFIFRCQVKDYRMHDAIGHTCHWHSIFQLLFLCSLLSHSLEILTVLLYKPTHNSLIPYVFLSRIPLFLLRREPYFLDIPRIFNFHLCRLSV